MRALVNLVLLLLAVGWAGCSTPGGQPVTGGGNAVHFLALTNFAGFTKSSGETPGTQILLSPELPAPIAWDELVLSWNANALAGTHLKFEARALRPSHATAFYTLGVWSEGGQPRESVNGQKDEDGDVKTDTLALDAPARAAQLRVTFSGPDAQTQPQLKFLGLCFLNRKVEMADTRTNRAAWGRSLAVPERSQLAYAGGRDWCSPTCVSMALAHWAKVLQRPELDLDVPDVARGVHDPNWPGTGNWPFNTAFAGRVPGMRACVTRFGGVSELEDWVAAGLPVIVSVSADLLNGGDEDKGNGHLVICVGFSEQGDPIINDPWAHLEKGEKVRRVCPRGNLVKAWRRSRNTVYLVYPETAALPPNPRGHWEGRPAGP